MDFYSFVNVMEFELLFLLSNFLTDQYGGILPAKWLSHQTCFF